MRRKLKSTLQLASTGQQNDNGGDPVEKKVTVMVAVMIGAFIMAWTPYSILALIETLISDTANMTDYSNTTIINRDGNFFYNGTVSPALATIPSLFAKTSAVLNPLIYGLLNTQVFINRIHSFSVFILNINYWNSFDRLGRNFHHGSSAEGNTAIKSASVAIRISRLLIEKGVIIIYGDYSTVLDDLTRWPSSNVPARKKWFLVIRKMHPHCQNKMPAIRSFRQSRPIRNTTLSNARTWMCRLHSINTILAKSCCRKLFLTI